MKKLVFAFVLTVSSFINAQKIEVSAAIFNEIETFYHVDSLKLGEFNYVPDSSIVGQFNLMFDLNAKKLIINESMEIEILNIEKNGQDIHLTLKNEEFNGLQYFEYCKISSSNKTVVLYHNLDGFIYGILTVSDEMNNFMTVRD